MGWESPEDAMPWVGLYIVVASFICTLAMAADVFRSFWQRKLWFPNKFFTLNASTITLIAIALKLPVDLTTDMSELETHNAKMIGIYFLIVMLANFLPSLGLMDDKELLMNIVALGILVITVIVNVSIQYYTQVLIPVPYYTLAVYALLFPFVLPFSVALTVSASRRILEQRYKVSAQMVSSQQEKRFSSKELRRYVKKYWVMTETRSPQFVIACSPVSSAFGVICASLTFIPTLYFVLTIKYGTRITRSEYKWSMKMIYIIQSIGIVVGSIAPIFRCVTSMGHYNVSKKWSKNQLNVFRVEKHWTEMLQQWKRSHVHSHIPGRHCKIIFHYSKETFLNFCIALHIMVLVLCKAMSLIPRTLVLVFIYCGYFLKLVLKRFKKEPTTSNSNVSVEIEEYTRYVVQIEEEAKLSKRILKKTLHSITQLLNESEKKEPHNLMKLLEKSTGFNGVLKFDNDQVPPLYQEETHNCWSLVVVTLTSIVIALRNTENKHFKVLLSGMREGLQIVRHIEECLNTNDDFIKTRKAATHGWTEVEVYRTWLQIELRNKARKGKTSKEILKWLGDEAAKIVIEFKSSKRPSNLLSPYKFILASSMYRISRTILLQCNEQEKLSNDEELLEWISSMMADILFACFTNLPRVIKMKCHHQAVEKRGDNIRKAAQLLGKSKKILKKLKAHQFPDMDLDSMAYIDKWRAITMSQMRNASVSSTRIQRGSSNSNESLIITIM